MAPHHASPLSLSNPPSDDVPLSSVFAPFLILSGVLFLPISPSLSLVVFVTVIALRQGTNWSEWGTQEKGDKKSGEISPPKYREMRCSSLIPARWMDASS